LSRKRGTVPLAIVADVKYWHWKTIIRAPKPTRPSWLCHCEMCGKEKIVAAYILRQLIGRDTADPCGHHGHRKHWRIPNGAGADFQRVKQMPGYSMWCSMLSRCENENSDDYHRYGGRGIRVCERWHSFRAFISDVGPPQRGKSLDRYPDNNGNYEPGNVRWATPTEQAKNCRRNIWMDHCGERMVASDWAKRLGIPASLLYYRKKMGWPDDAALTIPALTNATRSAGWKRSAK
jgi:hypothetical protein